jgi:hypothetical protein
MNGYITRRMPLSEYGVTEKSALSPAIKRDPFPAAGMANFAGQKVIPGDA